MSEGNSYLKYKVLRSKIQTQALYVGSAPQLINEHNYFIKDVPLNLESNQGSDFPSVAGVNVYGEILIDLQVGQAFFKQVTSNIQNNGFVYENFASKVSNHHLQFKKDKTTVTKTKERNHQLSKEMNFLFSFRKIIKTFRLREENVY